MSTTTIEHGSIKFTQTGYIEVVRHMRNIFNARQDYFFKVATAFHSLVTSRKIKTRREAYDLIDYKMHGQRVSFSGIPTNGMFWVSDESIDEIISEIFRAKNGSACKPRKSGFPKLTNKMKSFTIEIHMGSIRFHEQNNWIEWNVFENNNSVRDAHQDCMAKQLFSYLNVGYKWKRGEGGTFHYGDEHMWEDGNDTDPDCRTTEVSYRFGKK